ncbi:hypothetical protein [Gordonia rhizosphera]|nr:hypothetical protein [Gordonia rhizosphera]
MIIDLKKGSAALADASSDVTGGCPRAEDWWHFTQFGWGDYRMSAEHD